MSSTGTLQHTATNCDALQHAATHCNTLLNSALSNIFDGYAEHTVHRCCSVSKAFGLVLYVLQRVLQCFAMASLLVLHVLQCVLRCVAAFVAACVESCCNSIRLSKLTSELTSTKTFLPARHSCSVCCSACCSRVAVRVTVRADFDGEKTQYRCGIRARALRLDEQIHLNFQ